jgi:hypothetical protein
VRLFIGRALLFFQLFTVATAQARSNYFDIPVWPGDEESCPAPNNIENNNGIFSSSAKTNGVNWTGVIIDDADDQVIKFEKGVFVLAEDNSLTRGFINGCIYVTQQGHYLNMRIDVGENYEELMWVVKSTAWRPSRALSSNHILECVDQEPGRCGFFLKWM